MVKCFNDLKQSVSTMPVLKIPDSTRPFLIEPDANNFNIAAALLQEYDGILHPCIFFSRKLTDTETRWPTYDLEALSVYEPLTKHFYGILQNKIPVIFLVGKSIQFFVRSVIQF